ncbi:MAG: sigma-70 family RNA polymerase sigma factor [Planctomycetia bacterium]|nr:sigma-70 family RNA polymerase sigma factor [Planctomycetia bacterium]
MDDDCLIDQALAGNADAFGRLVARYQDRLFHAMTHIAGSAEDARDVVQDAFVQAFVKLESFRRTSGFYTWLYRIAFNVSATRRRRTRTNVSIDGNATGHALTLADPGSAPHDRLEQQERAARVRAALENLSEEFRTVLVLREMDDCDYETIAEMLDLPIGTVRSRLHRARLQMRELLKETMEVEKE